MPGVRQPSSPKTYRDAVIKRTESARVMSGLSREQLVDRLVRQTGQKLTVETYKKWETRTLIPHVWLIPFCDAVDTDPYFLLTGEPFRIGRHTQETAADPFGKRAAS